MAGEAGCVGLGKGGMVIIVGDAYEELTRLPSDHFDCVVTSPPYWGLRDYGVEGQLGLEPTMQEHIEAMLRICAEIHRVLKPSGTFWLNYGDSYARAGASNVPQSKHPKNSYPDHAKEGSSDGFVGRAARPGNRIGADCLKEKDLCMIPNRIAIALQEWGWWVRSEVIWGKSNPMPESVTDRPATAHEKIWLLSKGARYFYNAGAVRIERAQHEDANGFRGGSYTEGKPGPRQRVGNEQAGHGKRHAGFNDRWEAKVSENRKALRGPTDSRHRYSIEGGQSLTALQGRNLRNYEPAPVSVWEMATRPFPGAHFATFPPELVERCLMAGCPAGGKVLDPFGGAGTVGLVADSLNLDWTLIELNPDYAAMAEARIKARVAGKGTKERCDGTAELFT